MVFFCTIFCATKNSFADDIDVSLSSGNSPFPVSTPITHNLILYPGIGDGTVNIFTGADINGTIRGSVDGVGIVNVNNNYSSAATFFGTEPNSLRTLNVVDGGDLTLKNAAFADTINIGTAVTSGFAALKFEKDLIATNININNGSTLDSQGTDTRTITGNINGENNTGSFFIDGNTTKVLGTIGSTGKISDINISNGAVLQVENSVFATNINFSTGSSQTLETSGSNNILIDANLSATLSGAAAVLKVNTNTTVTGDVGDTLNRFNSALINDKSLTLKQDSYINSVVVGEVSNSAIVSLKLEGNLISSAGILLNNDANITTQTNSSAITGDITTNFNDKGSLNINAVTTIDGNIGTVSNALRTIDIANSSNLTVNGNLFATTVNVGDVNASSSSNFIITQNATVTNINLNNDSTLTAQTGPAIIITGNIKTEANNSGKFNVDGGSNTTVSGNLGSSEMKLKEVNILNDSTLQIYSSIFTNKINFSGGSNQWLSTNGVGNVTVDSVMTAAASGTASLSINANTIINNTVGDETNRFNSALINGKDLTLKQDSYINSITVGNGVTVGNLIVEGNLTSSSGIILQNNSSLITQGSDPVVINANITNNSNSSGSLIINTDTTINGTVTVPAQRLKSADVAAGKNLTLTGNFYSTDLNLLGTSTDSVLTVSGGNVTVSANINSAADNVNIMNFNATQTIVDGNIGNDLRYLKSAIIADNKSLIIQNSADINGRAYINELKVGEGASLILGGITFNSNGTGIILDNNSSLTTQISTTSNVVTINSKISTENNHGGIVNVNADTLILGQVGEDNLRLESVNIADEKSLTLNNSLLFADEIVLGNNSELITTGSDIVINANIIAADDNTSIVNLQANTTTIKGNIGDDDNEISDLLIANNKTAIIEGIVDTRNISIGNSSVLSFYNNVDAPNIVLSGADSVLGIGELGVNSDNKIDTTITYTTLTTNGGKLRIESNHTYEGGTPAAGSVDALMNAFQEIQVAEANLILNNDFNFSQISLLDQDSVLTFSKAGLTTVSGNITSASNNSGTLQVNSNVTLNGNVGVGNALAAVNISDGKTLTLGGVTYINSVNVGEVSGSTSSSLILNNHLNSSSIVLNNNSSLITQDSPGIDIRGHILTEEDNKGNLVINIDTNIFDKIGSSNKKLNSININDDSRFTIYDSLYANNIIFDGSNALTELITSGTKDIDIVSKIVTLASSSLVLTVQTNTNIIGDVGDDSHSVYNINIADGKNLTLKGTSYIDTINVGNASTGTAASLTLEGNLITDSGVALNNDSVLTTQNNALTITGNITSESNNTGILNINSDTTILGSIGTDTSNKLKAINIADGKSLTLNGNIYSTSLNLLNTSSDSSLVTTGGTVIIDTDINTSNNLGKLTFSANQTTVEGTIGSSTNKLKMLTIVDGKTATLGGVSYINTVNVGNDETSTAATLILQNNLTAEGIILNNGSSIKTKTDGIVIEGNITTTDDLAGEIVVGGDLADNTGGNTEILGNVGTSEKKINRAYILANRELTLKGSYYGRAIDFSHNNTSLKTAGTADIIISADLWVWNLGATAASLTFGANSTTVEGQAGFANGEGFKNLTVENEKTAIIKGLTYAENISIGTTQAGQLSFFGDVNSTNIDLADVNSVLGIGELGENSNGIIDTKINYSTLTTNGAAFSAGTLRIESNHRLLSTSAAGNTADSLINLFKVDNTIQVAEDKTLTLDADIFFKNIELFSGAALELTEKVLYQLAGDVIAAQDDVGTLRLGSEDFFVTKTVTGNIGASGKALHSLDILGGATVNLNSNGTNDNKYYINNINVGDVAVSESATLNLNNNLSSVGSNINLNNNSVMNVNITLGSVLSANILTETNNTGIVNIKNDVTLSGNIGSFSNRVNTIQVDAGKNLTLASLNNSFREEMYFNNIDMNTAGNTGSLTITGDTNGIFLGGNIGYDDSTKQGLIVSIKGNIEYEDGVTQAQALGGLLGTNDANPYVLVKDNTLLFKTVNDADITPGNSFLLSSSSDVNYFNDAALTYDSITKKLTLSVVVNGANRDLYVNVAAGNVVEAKNLSPAAKEIGDIIDKKWSFTNMTGGESAVVANLQNLTQEEFDEGLEELTPNAVLAMQKNSVTAIKNNRTSIDKRLRTLRNTIPDSVQNQEPQKLAAYGDANYYRSYRDLNKTKDYTNYSRYYSASDARNFWGEVFGGVSSGTQQDTNKTEGYDANNYGFTLGYDYSSDNKWTFGGAYTFSTNKAETSGENGGKDTLDITSNNVGIYSMYKDQSFFTEMFGGLAMHSYDQKRNIIFGNFDQTAIANYNGSSYNFGGALGYDFLINQEQATSFYDNRKKAFFGQEKTLLTPRISVLYSGLNIDDYSEKGANGANLNVTTQGKKILEGEAGLTLSHNKLISGNTSFLKEISLAVSYDFYNEVPQLDAVFLDDPNNKFTVYGEDPDPLFYQVGTALTLNNSNNYTFGVRYDFSFNSEIRAHLVKLNFISKF